MDTLNSGSPTRKREDLIKARKTYSEEFRRNDVELCRWSPGATVEGIAGDLTIMDSTLSAWLTAAGITVRRPSCPARTNTPPGDGSPSQEVSRLRARVGELEANERKLNTGRDILRAATKLFAGETIASLKRENPRGAHGWVVIPDITTWGWEHAPARQLIFAADILKLDRPLPRALAPDVDAARMDAIARLDVPFARTDLAGRTARDAGIDFLDHADVYGPELHGREAPLHPGDGADHLRQAEPTTGHQLRGNNVRPG